MKKKFCWSAIGSDSQKLVDTQTLVAHLEFCFIFVLYHLLAKQSKTTKIPNEQPAGRNTQQRVNKNKCANKTNEHKKLLYCCNRWFFLYFDSLFIFEVMITSSTCIVKPKPIAFLPRNMDSFSTQSNILIWGVSVMANVWTICIVYADNP